jgi:hypothetical protein
MTTPAKINMLDSTFRMRKKITFTLKMFTLLGVHYLIMTEVGINLTLDWEVFFFHIRILI